MDARDGTTDRAEIPRFLPEEPFPPYSYVTGRFPHPTRDPAGHHFGLTPERCAIPDPDRWRECRPYLQGLDLFNHGYYWEAHEVWEGVWHACGRVGLAASFMKGLIKLAAAGVKIREGRPEGVRTHAGRAAELFQQTARELPPDRATYFGLSLSQLVRQAGQLQGEPVQLIRTVVPPVEIVVPFALLPAEGSPAADGSSPGKV